MTRWYPIIITTLLWLTVALAASTATAQEPAATFIATNYYNNYGIPQSFGWAFVPNTTIDVTGLGHVDVTHTGLGVSHEVAIFDAGGVELADALVPAGTSAPLVGDFRLESISPITLNAGQTYTVASFYDNGTDLVGKSLPSELNVNPDITLATDPGRYFLGASGLLLPTDDYPYAFIGANFTLTADLASPEPGSLTLICAVGLTLHVTLRRKSRSRQGRKASPRRSTDQC